MCLDSHHLMPKFDDLFLATLESSACPFCDFATDDKLRISSTLIIGTVERARSRANKSREKEVQRVGSRPIDLLDSLNTCGGQAGQRFAGVVELRRIATHLCKLITDEL